jgi:hypothetical protein
LKTYNYTTDNSFELTDVTQWKIIKEEDRLRTILKFDSNKYAMLFYLLPFITGGLAESHIHAFMPRLTPELIINIKDLINSYER